MLQSCDDELVPSLTLSETEFTIPEVGGSQAISFETNVDWTAKSSESWCAVSPSSGDASIKSITVTITENETFDSRNSIVTITAGGISKSVTIKQNSNTGFLVSQNRFELSNAANTIEVEVKANIEFDVTISDDWITDVSTRALSITDLKFSIAENTSYDNREGTITIKEKGGSLSSEIKVFQSQENAIILSTKTYNLSSLYHSLKVELKTNVDFQVIIPEDAKNWISQPDTRALRDETLTFYVSANNTGYDARSTEIYIKDRTTVLQDTLTINQEISEDVLVEEGWYMKKTNGATKKFFPVGSWSIPGYTADRQNGYGDRTNAEFFKQQARNVDISVTDYRFWKDFMTEAGLIMMTVQPAQFLRYSHLEKIPELSNKGGENGYYRMQYLKEAIKNPSFIQEYDNSIISNKKHHPNVELAYLPIDEVAQGLYNEHWSVPPAVGDKIYERLNIHDPNSIVFVDLAGHGKGSSFFFEKRYLKTHSSMPKDPPYEAIVNSTARAYAEYAKTTTDRSPLLPFYEGYNGVPSYKFTSTSYSYTSYTPDELKTTHYENIKAYAQAYKGNGNAFGINAFNDFYAHPVLAGVTVDAIRAGLNDPEVPIWLFFDGNGYSKPSSMSAVDYAKQVRCQMYTSIIHGATGVFFWNNQDGTHDVWDAHQPTLEEIKSQYDIISLKTLEKRSDNDLHIMIKQDDNGQKYILASNTSKTKSATLSIDNVNKNTLAPLEVYVAPF